MTPLKALLAAALFFGASTMQVSAQAEDCVSPDGYPDRDIARNSKAIAGNKNLCLSDIEFTENGLNWKLTILENTKHTKGPTIFLLHDNEDSAFDTALYSITTYGGKLIAVEGKESRNFRNTQDPNRNFGKTKAETRVCRQMVRKPAPIFTQLLLDLRNTRANFFLTLHNNANGHTGNGGSGAISVNRKSSVLNGMPAPNGDDEDNAILLAGTKPPGEDKKTNKAIAYFHKAGVNVIYEHVRPESNDCSFSNYVVLNKLGQYYNIEAQHGHTQRQKQMLDVLMKYQRIRPRR